MKSSCFFILLSCFVFFSCNTTKPRDRERSYNKPYYKGDKDLQASLFLYHTDSTNSQLYFSINSNQLLYKKVDTSTYFSARVKAVYKIMPEAGSKFIIDSSTVYINDRSEQEPVAKQLTGYIPLKIRAGQITYLEVYLSDENGKRSHTRYMKCDKQNSYSQQNYILLGGGGQIYFSNKIEIGNTVVVNNGRVNYAKIRVDFFANDYSLPPPPFSPKEPQPYPSTPDSSFFVASSDGHSIPLSVTKQGVYYIRVDSSNLGGCMVMGVEQGFPKVQSHTQMIAATRFIMSKDEHQKLVTATDKQAAIDKFWVTLAGNEERARELIKRYYNRVQDANSFFSSHIEGWKTDMGMVYIIFGSPNKMYKTAQMETWTYGNEGTPNSATFRFEKINNPFSDNNFKLIRNASYKDFWYNAVNVWREGHVYLDVK